MNAGRCVFCGEPVKPGVDYRKETGWALQREKGTNALALREAHDEWACWGCIDKMKRGLDVGQGSLM